MNKVFAVFGSGGEGDGYTVFELIGIGSSLPTALAMIPSSVTETIQTHEHLGRSWTSSNISIVHSSMSKENNYTYVGKRKDCNDTCGYAKFGGYIVEEMELDVKQLERGD